MRPTARALTLIEELWITHIYIWMQMKSMIVLVIHEKRKNKSEESQVERGKPALRKAQGG